MIAHLLMPQTLRDGIAAQALAAFPRECCGLIEGRRENDTACALAVHPVRNLAQEPDRFELDAAEQFRLMRALRGTDRELIGCYHSHPNGRAGLSPRDRAGAGEDDFVWLIAGVTADGTTTWSCHAARESIWREVEIVTIEEHAPCT
jgi:proteasome lid subunit RPN8/RPN11